VTGGRIGIYAAPDKNSDGSYSPNPNSLYGSVFGAGRGRAGVGIAYGNDWTRYTYVSNTNVVINYDTIDNNNYITGNVFGGGNNGHVNNSTSVTVHSGRIGSDGNKGFGSLEGNVFGGGRGEERYEAYRRNASGKYCDANGTAVTFNDVIAAKDTLIYLYSKTINASQENYKTLGIAVDSLVSVTAGLVYGNTNVSINGDSAAAVRILPPRPRGGLGDVGRNSPLRPRRRTGHERRPRLAARLLARAARGRHAAGNLFPACGDRSLAQPLGPALPPALDAAHNLPSVE
jgi:hypothetical protein